MPVQQQKLSMFLWRRLVAAQTITVGDTSSEITYEYFSDVSII